MRQRAGRQLHQVAVELGVDEALRHLAAVAVARKQPFDHLGRIGLPDAVRTVEEQRVDLGRVVVADHLAKAAGAEGAALVVARAAAGLAGCKLPAEALPGARQASQQAVLQGRGADLAGAVDEAVAEFRVIAAGGVQRVRRRQPAVDEHLRGIRLRVAPGLGRQGRSVGLLGQAVHRLRAADQQLAEEALAPSQRLVATDQQVDAFGRGHQLEARIAVVAAQAADVVLGRAAGQCPAGQHVAGPAEGRRRAEAGRRGAGLGVHVLQHLAPGRWVPPVELGAHHQVRVAWRAAAEARGEPGGGVAEATTRQRPLMAGLPAHAPEPGPGDDVDHTGHRVGPVHRRAADLQHLDALDGLEWQGVDVGEDDRMVGQGIGREPARIEQHQRALPAKAPKRCRTGAGRGRPAAIDVGAAAAGAHRQRVEHVAQVGGTRALDVVAGDDLHRCRRFALHARDAGPRHFDGDASLLGDGRA
jgi:hypothetical protein